MNALTPNPKTGFLESRNPSMLGFTSDRKAKFIELATKQASMGAMPSVPNLCKAVDIAHHTFYSHIRNDPAFKQAWENTLDVIEDNLVQTMVTNGQRPSGFMDRIAWLRAHRPQRWNQDYKGQISSDDQGHKNVISQYSDIIDAEVVAEQPESTDLGKNNQDLIQDTENNPSNTLKSNDYQ